MSVVIETTIGDITVDLFTDERPVACLNFAKLCKLKYYNFNLFHTVERGFIAQSGDPTGAGDGGSSVWGVVEGVHKRFFEAESLPKIHHSSAGLLSLVSAGKNLVGSQFFLTLGENLHSLDGQHCVIGEVVEGHETLRKLNEAIVDEAFRPYQDIRITHTVLLDDPFADPRGFQVPSRSPSPSAERLKNGRIAADEDIDDTDGKSMEEIQEMLAEREAKARATILEIVGDLPDAEMAPPENVLFVCKLNPVTTDDDLEIIFSRFGKVKSCEVIRDKKSGDSLQYAFIEFEEQKSCELAYFKMDNVLIDDRRIHVDFSQSVAKVKWRGKGRGVDGPDGRLDFNDLRSGGQDGKRERHRADQRPTASKRPAARSPNRMNSEERRKAREERHRLQQEKEREQDRSKQRERERDRQRERKHRAYSRSRSRSHSKKRDHDRRPQCEDRYYGNRREDRRRQQPKDQAPLRDEHKKHRQSRSISRDRVRRQSPDRRSAERRRAQNPDGQRRSGRDMQLPAKQNRDAYAAKAEKRKSNGQELDSKRASSKDRAKKKKDIKRKKHKRSSSTSESASDSDTESSSSSSASATSSDTSSDSSDENERKKKKLSKVTHKKKGKKSNKKAKKHRK